MLGELNQVCELKPPSVWSTWRDYNRLLWRKARYSIAADSRRGENVFARGKLMAMLRSTTKAITNHLSLWN